MCTIVEAVGPSPRDNLRRRQQCSDGHDSLGPARRLDAVLTTDHLLSPIARTTPIDQGRCSHHQSAMLVARRQYLNCCSETTAGQSMRKVSNPRHVRNRRRDTSSRLSPSLVGTRAYMPPSTGKRTRDCVWAGCASLQLRRTNGSHPPDIHIPTPGREKNTLLKLISPPYQ